MCSNLIKLQRVFFFLQPYFLMCVHVHELCIRQSGSTGEKTDSSHIINDAKKSDHLQTKKSWMKKQNMYQVWFLS